MLIRKPLIFFTLIFSIVAVFAVSEVWAECDPMYDDYECSEVTNKIQLRVKKPFPNLVDCVDDTQYPGTEYPCSQSDKYSVYEWEYDDLSLPGNPGPSHITVTMDKEPFETAIMGGGLDCSGSGDPSTCQRFGHGLSWTCSYKFSDLTQPLRLIVKGELSSGPKDYYSKAGNDADCCDDFSPDAWGIILTPAVFCGREATGVFTSSRICVNLPGTEEVGDEAHAWFFRNDDAENCIDTEKDFYICIGTCPDSFPDPIPSTCQKLTGTPDALHIIGSNLVGQSCPDELFKQSFTNSPFYFYETWAGGYYYSACYDYGTFGGSAGWKDVRCCTVPGFCP
jgi:hypothetical protein